MNNPGKSGSFNGMLVAAAIGAIVSGCASMPTSPPGSADVRNKLMNLQSNAALASTVPVALEQAEAAVKLAETPQPDAELAAHRVFMADHMVDTARATAETRLAESQRAALKAQSDAARLAARTREADAAQNAAVNARNEAAAAKAASDAARGETAAALLAAQNARNEAESIRNAAADAATAAEMRRRELAEQISLLQARETDRGIVLTLGDVLFATGSASLKPGAIGNLDRLVTFLDKYADRKVLIEGHTDNVGTNATNEDLSLRRADSVRGYLTSKGVSPMRLASLGKGEMQPVASNDSAEGRQQNRRVEVVIDNDRQAAMATR